MTNISIYKPTDKKFQEINNYKHKQNLNGHCFKKLRKYCVAAF